MRGFRKPGAQARARLPVQACDPNRRIRMRMRTLVDPFVLATGNKRLGRHPWRVEILLKKRGLEEHGFLLSLLNMI